MKIEWKSSLSLSVALALAAALSVACAPSAARAGDGCCRGGQAISDAGSIPAVARSAGSFKTLLAALEAAGLAETLAGEGPFTVFAPTDEAFAKLPPGTVEALLNDIPRLKAILTYHVVAGKVGSGAVVKLKEAKTLNGRALAIDTRDGVRVGGAKVVKADVEASNGVIHVIDAVLIPPQPTPM
jgi:uncharacterized surface protein with fasciclin (FAS1) repeats